MNCPLCNAENPNDAKNCVSCGASLVADSAAAGNPTQHQNTLQPTNENHPKHTLFLVLGILETLFCCLVGGIVAIITNNNANKAFKAGDDAAYQKELKNVKIWLIISPIIGIICSIASLLLNK